MKIKYTKLIIVEHAHYHLYLLNILGNTMVINIIILAYINQTDLIPTIRGGASHLHQLVDVLIQSEYISLC